MSGKPYPQGVQQLSTQFRELHTAQQEIARLEGVIATETRALEKARAAESAAALEIKRLMTEMDVHAPGNFGYEGRLLWLLRELNMQAEQYGRLNQ